MLKKLIPEFSIFLAYLICFLITDRILFPIQSQFFESKPLLSAALIFLPHGVRVISTVVYGLRSLIPLFCAHLFIFIFPCGNIFYPFDAQRDFSAKRSVRLTQIF